MTRPRMGVTRQIVGDRFVMREFDLSGDAPRILGGYEYTTPAASGQVADLPGLSRNERALCIVRNHRANTTVNGVCLDCLRQKGKYRGQSGARK